MVEEVYSNADIEPDKIRGTALNHTDDQFIEGNNTFTNLNINTTTRRLAIPSAGFSPTNNTDSYLWSVGFIRNTSPGNKLFIAPVFLPDGATVTDLKATFIDSCS